MVYDGVPIPPARDIPSRGRVVVRRRVNPSSFPESPCIFRTNLFDDLSTASVFLYVSEMEGLGSAALAAMAAGVPVVASGVGGLPEVVEHERTGLIVRDGDFAGAVRRLLEIPSSRPNWARPGGRKRSGILGGKNGGIDAQRVP